MLQHILMMTKRFIKDDNGIGVVELILILVVLIGLTVIFRDQLTSLINGIFERIVNDSNAV
ncbi:MAG: hypothetical protein K6F34_09470 [Lachnospiraceae bacterium]|nr:hypothetical protein [Lachnospiraceae bacterium]